MSMSYDIQEYYVSSFTPSYNHTKQPPGGFGNSQIFQLVLLLPLSSLWFSKYYSSSYSLLLVTTTARVTKATALGGNAALLPAFSSFLTWFGWDLLLALLHRGPHRAAAAAAEAAIAPLQDCQPAEAGGQPKCRHVKAEHKASVFTELQHILKKATIESK